MGGVGSLPGEVVVPHDRRATTAHLRHGVGGCRVERERAEVLHDDAIEAVECVGERLDIDRNGVVEPQTLDGGDALAPLASDLIHLKAERLNRR